MSQHAKGILLATGVAVIVAAAGVIGWTAVSGPAPVPAKSATVVPPSLIGPVRVPFSRTWDFNTPEQADDFKVLTGSWHHIADGGSGGKGCMESNEDQFVAKLVGTGVSSAKLPILITFHERVVPPDPATGYMFGVTWDDANFRWWGEFINLGPIRDVSTKVVWHEVRIYLSESFGATVCDGRLIKFSAYELNGNGSLGLIMRGGLRVSDLTIQEITAGELPNVRAYLAVLEKIEPSKRVGRVIMPELKSGCPPDPVYINFVKNPEANTGPAQKK